MFINEGPENLCSVICLVVVLGYHQTINCTDQHHSVFLGLVSEVFLFNEAHTITCYIN